MLIILRIVLVGHKYLPIGIIFTKLIFWNRNLFVTSILANIFGINIFVNYLRVIPNLLNSKMVPKLQKKMRNK